MSPRTKKTVQALSVLGAVALALASCGQGRKAPEQPARPVDEAGRPIVATTGEVAPAIGSLGLVSALPELLSLKCEGADRYRFQIAEGEDFASILFEGESGGNALTPTENATLAAGGSYYWRVMARADGAWGPWSKPGTFSLSGLDTAGALPEPGAFVREAQPGLTWPRVDGAAGYELRYAPTDELLAAAPPVRAAEPSYRLPERLKNFADVLWRYRAVDSSGVPGGWSPILSFSVRWNPDIFAVYPPSGGRTPDPTPAIAWSPVAGAAAYVLQLSETPEIFDPLQWVDTREPSHSPEKPFADLTRVFWRVRARSEDGLYGAWQGPWSFVVDRAYVEAVPAARPVAPTAPPAPPPTAPVAQPEPVPAEAPVLGPAAPLAAQPLVVAAPLLAPAPIFLNAPEQASTLTDTTPTFDWSDAEGALAYAFQLATDPLFARLVEDADGLGASSFAVETALENGGTYYWRASARLADGEWSPWTDPWSFVVRWSPGVAPTYPPNAGRIPETRPTLGWTPIKDAIGYELQIADRASAFDSVGTFRSEKPAFQPAAPLPNLAVRYWRVRPENADRVFGPWQGPWSFTVEVPKPSPALPPDGASLADTTPIFGWSETPGAIAYRLQIGADAGFESPITDAGELKNAAFEQSPALGNDMRYYWRVMARNADGVWSAWSATRSFSISWKPSIAAVYPVDGARIAASRPVLSWSPAPEAEGYEIQIADGPAGFAAARSIAAPGPSYQPANPYANSVTKLWRVRARNADGAFGSWAGPWYFTVELERPTPAAPADGAKLSDATPDFKWSAVQGASGYRFQLSADPGFASLAISTGRLTSPAYSQWEPLKNGQTYYWRVMAQDEEGVWSSWTEPRSLVVDWSPEIRPESPRPGAEIADATPVLEWTEAPQAVLYEVQLADSVAGFAFASSVAAAAPRLQVAQAVPNGATKHWRVRARNSDGIASSWQGPWSFTVSWNPPLSPVKPADGGAAAEAAPLLDWTDAPEAVSYQIQLASSVDVLGTAPLISSPQSQYQVESELSGAGRLFWRARPRNIDGIFGAWQGPWSFKPAPRPAPAPAPAPAQVGAPLAVKLSGLPSRIYDEAVATARAAVVPTPDSSVWSLDGVPIPNSNSTSLTVTGDAVAEGPHTLTYTARRGATSVSASIDFEKVPGSLVSRLLSPADGAVFHDPAPSFDWTDRAEADAYRIQISEDPGFAAPVVDASPVYESAFSTKPPLATGRTYHWRLAWRAGGTWSPWTDSFSFTIPLPSPPAPKEPADRAALTAPTPTFAWEAAQGAVSYEIALARSLAALDAAQVRAVPATRWAPSTELALGAWYWRVRSVDARGNKGDWGESRRLHRSLLDMVDVRGGRLPSLGAGMTVSSFSLGRNEVTQNQYKLVVGTWSGSFVGDLNRPAEQLTWYDAVEFCNKLSALEGLQPVYSITGRTPATGHPITNAVVTADWGRDGYRLPTEAEWEWAARGGSAGKGATYAGSGVLEEVGWYTANSEGTTKPVGGKAPNELGLFDMSGNVWEWCWDWFDALPPSAQIDYRGADGGTARVARGGGWNNSASACAVSARNSSLPGNRSSSSGLRVARPKL